MALATALAFGEHGTSSKKLLSSLIVDTGNEDSLLKAQGVQLGNHTNLLEAQAKGQAINAARAAAFKLKVLPTIKQLQAEGKTLDAIATELTERNVATFNGGVWHKSTVSRLLKATAQL